MPVLFPMQCQTSPLYQKNLYKNIQRFAREPDEMETDECSNTDIDYNPMDDSILDETVIDEKLLVETIDLVLTDSSVRNLSIFSYALLKRFGITAMEIRTFFPSIGLQSEKSCRENLFQCQKSDFGKQCGGQTTPTFYEDFPEIENTAKLFVLEEIQKKSCNFRVLEGVQSAKSEILPDQKICIGHNFVHRILSSKSFSRQTSRSRNFKVKKQKRSIQTVILQWFRRGLLKVPGSNPAIGLIRTT